MLRQLGDAGKRLQLGFANLLAALELQSQPARLMLHAGDVTRAAQAAVDRIRPLAEAAGVAVRVETESPVALTFDESKVARILDVVLANAAAYGRRGGMAEVTVRTDVRDAVIQVDDDGIGIPEAELPRLFKPLARGVEAAKAYPDGLGLGLYVAKAYATLHGGTLSVHPRAGGGTRVLVTLPLRPPGA
jgi:signal transduction histidine kinase